MNLQDIRNGLSLGKDLRLNTGERIAQIYYDKSNNFFVYVRLDTRPLQFKTVSINSIKFQLTT